MAITEDNRCDSTEGEKKTTTKNTERGISSTHHAPIINLVVIKVDQLESWKHAPHVPAK
jgi:hypothetical protein